jgi:hypothetical protein
VEAPLSAEDWLAAGGVPGERAFDAGPDEPAGDRGPDGGPDARPDGEVRG